MAKSFTFKQFHIDAFGCGMPVSTDAILLGAWANIDNVSSVLDIGCGTGVLALMCAQRNAQAAITGIEIEENAYLAASQNCKNSIWSNRLTIAHISLQDYANKHSSVDAIICNPPYFNDGQQSAVSQRAMARHTASLTHQSLLVHCEKLLKDNGTASFVLPKQEGDIFINIIEQMRLSGTTLCVTRIVEIKTTLKKPVSRLLIEVTKKPVDALSSYQKSQLLIHDQDNYSSDFIALTKDFYLKM